MVANISMRREIWTVLAAQTHGDKGREAANNHPFGIYHDPFTVGFVRLGTEGLHGVSSK
jgi:hypothetical protein